LLGEIIYDIFLGKTIFKRNHIKRGSVHGKCHTTNKTSAPLTASVAQQDDRLNT
jgi:hypothetical protein